MIQTRTLGELYIDGFKGTKTIAGKIYRLKNWVRTKKEAEIIASYVRGKGELARILLSSYKERKVYLVFHSVK